MSSLGSFLNRALHRGADRAVHLAAAIGYRLPPGNPGRYGVERLRDIPYRDTNKWAHLLDVYRPRERPAMSPVVLYVHGGGFAMLSKETHRLMALAFARRGYVVVNINYRLGRRYPYPAPLEDAAEALRWVQANIARYGGDPARLVLAGESAGANLVTALTIACHLEQPEPFLRTLYAARIRPAAVLAIYGLLEVSDIGRFWRRRPLPAYLRAQIAHAAESYVGEPYAEKSRSAPLASPLRLLEALSPGDAAGLPPFFAAAGTRDPVMDDSRRLAAALGRLGVGCELVIHPGEIHGYNAFLWRPAARDMWRRTFEFLRLHVPAPGLSLAPEPKAG